MALITDLPTNSSPASSDYMITDNGTTTSKSTLNHVKTGMGIDTSFSQVFLGQMTSSTSPKSYTVASSSRALILIFGAGSNFMGIYMITASSSGAVAKVEIAPASSVTVTTSTNTLTVSDSASTTIFVYALVFNGSVG